MGRLIDNLLYIDVNILIRILITCAICHFLTKPFSKLVYKRTGYNSDDNEMTKFLKYLTAVAIVVEVIFNGAGTSTSEKVRIILLLTVVLLYALLIICNKKAGIGFSIILSLLQSFGSVFYTILFIVSCFAEGAANTSQSGSYGNGGNYGNQYDADAEIRAAAERLEEQARSDAQYNADSIAHGMGFHNAEEATSAGFDTSTKY